ncbi:MAG: molecular chaperone [Actinomycetes bacterium]
MPHLTEPTVSEPVSGPGVPEPALLAVRLDELAAACSFLSRLFLAPVDEHVLAAVADPDLLADWPLERDVETRAGLSALGRAGAGPSPESLPELRRDHERLLVGPAHVVACPYESVYLSEEHLIFERQTLEVRAFYARFGLEAPRLNSEPDDHIGLELDFVAHLCLRALDALDTGDASEAATLTAAVGDFLRGHLLLWVHDCLRRLEDGAQTEFYRGVARLTRGTVQQLEAEFCGD